MEIVNPYTLPTIDFVGGSTQDLAFHCFVFTSKYPFDLSACTADFSIISYVNKMGEPLLSKEMTISGSGEDGESVDNVLNVTLTPNDTVDLYGKYIYQITVKSSSGEVEIPNQGLLYIVNNINKTYVQ